MGMFRRVDAQHRYWGAQGAALQVFCEILWSERNKL